MGKCPYCSAELHIEDFFEVSKKETKKGKIKVKVGVFKGESIEANSASDFNENSIEKIPSN